MRKLDVESKISSSFLFFGENFSRSCAESSRLPHVSLLAGLLRLQATFDSIFDYVRCLMLEAFLLSIFFIERAKLDICYNMREMK